MNRDHYSLPFPLEAGYSTLALNGVKGGGTKYITLQFLNYARWTSQQHSVNFPDALQIIWQKRMFHPETRRFMPLGFFAMWRPGVTCLNETVLWGMKVPLAMFLYDEFYKSSFGPHLGLFCAVALSTLGEIAAVGWSERFSVHMSLQQIGSYRQSLLIARGARGSWMSGVYAGAGAHYVRSFSWNIAFFEWKRFLHGAVAQTPQGSPAWFETHLKWLRSLEKKNQANVLTFEAATFGTYLTFFSMAGDNVKTKMQHDPVRYPSFLGTVHEIWLQHGLLGFTRGSVFKGFYIIVGATIAVGVQERLTEIMTVLLRGAG